jgi:hypothetical protein
VTYWAGRTKNYIVPVAKVTGRLRDLSAELKKTLEARAALAKRSREEGIKLAALAVPVRERIGVEPNTYAGGSPFGHVLENWTVAAHGYGLRLANLTLDEVNAILDAVKRTA